MKIVRSVAVLIIMGAVTAWRSGAGSIATFYFANAGNDSNACTITQPCQTIAHFNSMTIPNNSLVAFNGGDSFSGGILVSSDGLSITSYGSGQAIINSGLANCVYALNHASLSVSNIVCEPASGSNAGNLVDGIKVENNSSGSTNLLGPTIINTTIQFYGGAGIYIYSSGSGTAGFNTVTINENVIYKNTINLTNAGPTLPPVTAGSGIQFLSKNFGTTPGVFANVYINNNVIKSNCGTPSTGFGSGLGMDIDAVQTGLVHGNLVANNGQCNVGVGPAGPVGILMNGSDKITVEFNEVYGQDIGANVADGEGIDFDVQTTNSIAQYNYVHGNTSAEILTFGAGNNNVIRFNIIEAVSDQGIELLATPAGGVGPNTQIYNNTINTAVALTGAFTSTCLFNNQTGGETIFANNICNAIGTHVPVLMGDGQAGTHTKMAGNAYFSDSTSGFAAQWNLTGVGTFTTLAGIHGAGFEVVGGINTGTIGNPNLVDRATLVTITPANTTGVLVSPPCNTVGGWSPLCPLSFSLTFNTPTGKGNGINLVSAFPATITSVGLQDFFGNAITSATSSMPIGASANK